LPAILRLDRIGSNDLKDTFPEFERRGYDETDAFADKAMSRFLSEVSHPRSLVPGQYKLFAWDNVPVGAWMNTEFIGKFEGRGTSVSINAGSRQSAQARLIAATRD
jgi:hypothetical protein